MSNTKQRWILTVIKDPDSEDLMVELPDDLIKAMNWKIGDELNWESKEGYFLLTKVGNPS
jgi:uncharacterized membrane protein (UPF0127 family)